MSLCQVIIPSIVLISRRPVYVLEQVYMLSNRTNCISVLTASIGCRIAYAFQMIIRDAAMQFYKYAGTSMLGFGAMKEFLNVPYQDTSKHLNIKY